MSGGGYWDQGPSGPNPPLTKFTGIKEAKLSRSMPEHRRCRHCSKPFVQFGRLQQHLRLHSAARPFVCRRCKQDFSQLRYLQNHQTIKHAREIKCKQCSETFSQIRIYYHHVIQCHGVAFLKLPKNKQRCQVNVKSKSSEQKLSLKVCIKKSVVAESDHSWSVKKKKKKHKKQKRKSEKKSKKSQKREKLKEDKRKYEMEENTIERPKLILKFKMPKPADKEVKQIEETESTVQANQTKPVNAGPSKPDQFTEIVQSPSPKDSGIDDCSPLHETDHTENCSNTNKGNVTKETKLSPVIENSIKNNRTDSGSAVMVKNDCGYDSCADTPDKVNKKSSKSSQNNASNANSLQEESVHSHCLIFDQSKKQEDDLHSFEQSCTKAPSVSPSPTPSLKMTLKKSVGKLRTAKYTSSLHVSPVNSEPPSPAVSNLQQASPSPTKHSSKHSRSTASTNDNEDPYLDISCHKKRSGSKSPRQSNKNGKSPRYAKSESWSPEHKMKSCESPSIGKCEKDKTCLSIDIDDNEPDPYAFDDGPSTISPKLKPYTSKLPRRSDKYKLDPLPPILEPQLSSSFLPTSPVNKKRPRLTKQTDLPIRKGRKLSAVMNEEDGQSARKYPKLEKSISPRRNFNSKSPRRESTSITSSDKPPKLLKSSPSSEPNILDRSEFVKPAITKSPKRCDSKSTLNVKGPKETKADMPDVKSAQQSDTQTTTLAPPLNSQKNESLPQLATESVKSPPLKNEIVVTGSAHDDALDKLPTTTDTDVSDVSIGEKKPDAAQNKDKLVESDVTESVKPSSPALECIKNIFPSPNRNEEATVLPSDISLLGKELHELNNQKSLLNDSADSLVPSSDLEEYNQELTVKGSYKSRNKTDLLHQIDQIETDIGINNHETKDPDGDKCISNTDTNSECFSKDQSLESHTAMPSLMNGDKSSMSSDEQFNNYEASETVCNAQTEQITTPTSHSFDHFQHMPVPDFQDISSFLAEKNAEEQLTKSKETKQMSGSLSHHNSSTEMPLDDSDLLLSDPHLDDLSLENCLLNCDDLDSVVNYDEKDLGGILGGTDTSNMMKNDKSKSKADGASNDPIVVQLPAEAGMEPLSLVIDNEDSDPFEDSGDDLDLQSSLSSAPVDLAPPLPSFRHKMLGIPNYICGVTAGDDDSEFADLQEVDSPVPVNTKDHATTSEEGSEKHEFGFFNEFAKFVGVKKSPSITGVLPKSPIKGYDSEFAKFLGRNEKNRFSDESKRTAVSIKASCCLNRDPMNPSTSLACEVCVNCVAASKVPELDQKKLLQLQASHGRISELSDELLRLCRAIFPHLELPKYGSGPGSVLALVEQVLCVVEDRPMKDTQAIPLHTSGSEVQVRLCSEPHHCLHHLRQRACVLLERILPQLELPSNFNRTGRDVDDLLRFVIQCNVT